MMQIAPADLTAAASQVMQSLAPQKAATSPASLDTTASSSGSDTMAAGTGTMITSNDFLTLLVTEMKNQDPTQPTDPNAYIQQLVGVNSLQQLISINQDLSSLSTPASGSTSAPGSV